MSTGLFKNIHYDRRSNSIYLWEYDPETKKTTKRKYEYENKYFVKSNTPTGWTDIFGNHMQMQTAEPKENTKQLATRLREMGKPTGELNYDPRSKFLLWRYGENDISKTLSELGFHNVFNVGALDIEVAFEKGKFPEADKAEYPINLLTIVQKSGKATTFADKPYTGKNENGKVQDFYFIDDEVARLDRFFKFIGRDAKLDIITGWYSSGFDIPYIFNRYMRINPNCIEVDDGYKIILKIPTLPMGTATYDKRMKVWTIDGMSHIDYQLIYKQFTFDPHESYSLDYVAKRILKKGKMPYIGKNMYEFYTEHWNPFVEYNIIDTELIFEIDAKIAFLELYAVFAYSSLIPFDRCDSSIAQIEGYIARYLHKRNQIFPDTEKGKQEAFDGAYVMANKGKYKNLLSFDATSLYPSIIVQWNISPETKVMSPQGDTSHLISTARPNQFYKKDFKGIVPEIVDDIFNLRKSWKNKYTDAKSKGMDKAYVNYCYNLQLNYKILANSFYGVLGHPSFVFYDLDNASLIPLHGQHIIKYFGEIVAKGVFDKMTHRQFDKMFPEFELTESEFESAKKEYKDTAHCLSDTDSFYISLDAFYKRSKAKLDFWEFASIMVDRLYTPYNNIMGKKWSSQFNVNEYRIHFKREKIISDMIVFAKKKYVCYVYDSEGTTFCKKNEDKSDWLDENGKREWMLDFEVVGLEIKRTDVSEAVRGFARKVIDWIIEDKDKYFINKEVIKLKTKFQGLMNIEDICLKKGVREYDKYAVENPFRSLKAHTPIGHRASMYHNEIIKQLGIIVPPITNSAKIRYVFVKPRKNRWRINVIAWQDEFPPEFEEHFDIDYDEIFDKTIVSVVTRLFDAVGWSAPTTMTNSLFDD